MQVEQHTGKSWRSCKARVKPRKHQTGAAIDKLPKIKTNAILTIAASKSNRADSARWNSLVDNTGHKNGLSDS